MIAAMPQTLCDPSLNAVRRRMKSATLLLLSLLLTASGASAAPPAADPIAKLKSLAADPKLQLHGDDENAKCFVITVDFDHPQAAAHVRVERDGTNLALLVSSP